MPIKLKPGGLYEARNGAILEVRSGFDRRNPEEGNLLVLRGARDIIVSHEYYVFKTGNNYWYLQGGLFGGKEAFPDFGGHIVREIEP
jgi:hypothetical protein